MTIQQTIDIPANRKIHLDLTLPEGAPFGKTELVLEFKPAAAVKNARGMEMISAEQLKTLLLGGRGIAAQGEYNAPLDLRETQQAIAWKSGKKIAAQSFAKYAGCLKDSGVFEGDSVAIQREMRREWD